MRIESPAETFADVLAYLRPGKHVIAEWEALLPEVKRALRRAADLKSSTPEFERRRIEADVVSLAKRLLDLERRLNLLVPGSTAFMETLTKLLDSRGEKHG